jgi:hypothetical protein
MRGPVSVGRAILRTVVLAAIAGSAHRAGAQSLSVSGSPPTLKIRSATAGLAPNAVTNATTTYTIAIPSGALRKITARLNSAMPAGVTLTAALAAPPGATSSGAVALDATARTVVNNIPNMGATTRSITYVLTATAAAGVVTVRSRTVTFTVALAP